MTALRIAKRNQDHARAADWETCICGEKHALVFTTRSGHPIEPRNINRAFDVRCARYGVRRITLHDTRRTCGSLLAALDVRPRIAMAILRQSRISLTPVIQLAKPRCCTWLLYGTFRRLLVDTSKPSDLGGRARRDSNPQPSEP